MDKLPSCEIWCGPLVMLAQERVRGERMAAQLRELSEQRRAAREVNDDVIQALTTLGQVLEEGDVERSRSLVQQALTSARLLMDDWLAGGTDLLTPGDLIRISPSGAESSPIDPVVRPLSRAASEMKTRVLVVDDDIDLRAIFALQVESAEDMEVVGQAGDGREAVELAAALHPDVVLLDMAMPVMDGLQALPEIMNVAPDTRVIVVSAFDEKSLADQAISLGAARYLEKGVSMELVNVVRSVLPMESP